MSTTQVLVVGAGPTGLLMAGELARHGIVPRIVERLRHASPYSKALGVHARTLEIFYDLGIADGLLRRAIKVHGFNAFANGKRIVHLGFDELPTPYPYIAVLPQRDTEEVLGAWAEQRGVAVERETTLTKIRQDANGVEAILEHKSGETETVKAAWVVACDGAHSTVRTMLDVPFEGEDIESDFVLADAQVDWDWSKDEAYVFFSPDGVLGFIPLPADNYWRIVANFPAGRKAPDATLETFQKLVKERCHARVEVSNPTWLANFGIRQRKAASFRVGRVFFAGDAAHCHSPAGGQGMNTGLQDAYNLAWKLALYVRGNGRSELLDSYHAERAPIADSLLRGTGTATRVISLRHPVSQKLRNMLASFVTDLEVVQERASRTIGELDLNYRGSPIVAEDRMSILLTNLTEDRSSETPWVGDWKAFAAGPRAGERAPDVDFGAHRLYTLLRGTQHVLLLFDGRAATAAGYDKLSDIAETIERHYAEHVAIHAIIPQATVPELLRWKKSVLLDPEAYAHRAYGAGAECIYLVRPDGYIAYRSLPPDKESLRQFLERIFI